MSETSRSCPKTLTPERQQQIAQEEKEYQAFLDSPSATHTTAPPPPLPRRPALVTKTDDVWASDRCDICGEEFNPPLEATARLQHVTRIRTQADADAARLDAMAPAHSLDGEDVMLFNTTLTRLKDALVAMTEQVDHAWGAAARYKHIAHHAQLDVTELRHRLLRPEAEEPKTQEHDDAVEHIPSVLF